MLKKDKEREERKKERKKRDLKICKNKTKKKMFKKDHKKGMILRWTFKLKELNCKDARQKPKITFHFVKTKQRATV